jgi:hypothetical protein
VTHSGYVVFGRRGTTDASIARTTNLESFSNATARGATLAGLACESGADAWCSPDTAVGSSSCGLCPRP